MKFLEAKKLDKGENKMLPGTRPDQKIADTSPPLIKQEVRDLAQSLGIDLIDLRGHGTGQNGAITLKDVKQAKDKKDAIKDR